MRLRQQVSLVRSAQRFTLALTFVIAAACNRSAPAKPDPLPPAVIDTETSFFRDVTKDSGIEFAYRNGEEAKEFAILETLGGGVALFDYDGDGLLDIFVTGGGYFEGKQVLGHRCALYRNLGGMKFKDVTAEVGLDGLRFYTHGCAVADYDRDGWPDLLVTGWGGLALLHNASDGKGGRRFVDVTAKAGLDDKRWSTSAAWGDLDGDGWPDLYVCHYVAWHPEKTENHCIGFDGVRRDICPPANYAALPHVLYRNQGDGAFRDVSAAAGLRVQPTAGNFGKGLGVLCCDLNGDGKPDLYVANDMTGNFLYLNQSSGKSLQLQECGSAIGAAYDSEGHANGSMGLAVGDYDGTGRPSLWVTNYEYELHALYRPVGPAGRLVFQHVSSKAGIASLNAYYVGWGTAFLDFDRDGWEDLVFCNGHPNYFPRGGHPKSQLPVLLHNEGNARFKNVPSQGGAYFSQAHHGRGLAIGDLDNDGQPDLVIAHLNEPIAVLRGIAPPQTHWLGLELIGRDHRNIAGATVVIAAGGRKQTKFAVGGGSYLSANDPRLLVGLGTTARIDSVTVVWPWGATEIWRDVAVDGYRRLEEGRGSAP